MTINIKTIVGKVDDVVKSIPAAPPIKTQLPPPIKTQLPPPVKIPPPKTSKPKGVQGPVGSFFQKIKDYFVTMKQRFLIAVYVIAGIIFVGLLIKFWPLIAGLWTMLTYVLRLVVILR